MQRIVLGGIHHTNELYVTNPMMPQFDNFLKNFNLFTMGNSFPTQFLNVSPSAEANTTTATSINNNDNGYDVASTSSTVSTNTSEPNKVLPPECSMTTPEIVTYSGYGVENHVVVTKDNYLLTMHRIPHGRLHNQSPKLRRPSVILQHGILADSACWVSNGPDNSLAFILADAGFDVWLGNIRGGTYSRNHTKLDPNRNKEYWRFTWQDMAEKDFPAMVDHVLEVSGNTALYYIGHSQGTLMAFAGLAANAVAHDKIHKFFALAPVYRLKNLSGPLTALTPLATNTFINTLLPRGGAEVLPKSEVGKWMISNLFKYCNTSVSGQLRNHGSNLMMFICGVHAGHYFEDRLPVYFSHTPAGTSLHNLVHFSQMIQTGKTSKFDYGTAKRNIEKHGKVEPPSYDVSTISTPISLFFGSLDRFTHKDDRLALVDHLPNIQHNQEIEDFDHLDFLWGTRAPEILYQNIIEQMNEIECNIGTQV